MKKSAIISNDGLYRYRLDRVWKEDGPLVLFLMLNPSTADATKDDATITRCINYAKSWGYGGLVVGNLFAFRSTKPKNLLAANNPIGDDNLMYLDKMFLEVSGVICAWGNGGIVKKLGKKLGEDYKPLKGWFGHLAYLELAKDGTPKHPLYLKKELQPIRFEVMACRVNDKI